MALKVAFKTIGCKVNQYETAIIRASFLQNGYQVAGFQEDADIYIINTCAVTREAQRKSMQMIRKAIRSHPLATNVVTGCLVHSDLLNIQECKDISFIVGNSDKENIFTIINQAKLTRKVPLILVNPPEKIINYKETKYYSTSNRMRGFVKVQDGCNQFCSYCLIPYLRGRARSRSVNNILSEIRDLAQRGYKEVVLLGINLGSYGNDLAESNVNLENLIYQIEHIPHIERIRLSSIELPFVTEGIKGILYSSPKICHHLHIPLQSGDDRILSLMHRKYTSQQYKKIVSSLKDCIPDLAITTDVIVGFPGEDEKAFQKTIDLIQEIGFSKVHVFPFSERKFNLALFLPNKIEKEKIKQRSRTVNNLSLILTREFIQKNLGKEKYVLIEQEGENENGKYVFGLTDNYMKVFIYGESVKKGKIIKVKIVQANDDYAVGITV